MIKDPTHSHKSVCDSEVTEKPFFYRHSLWAHSENDAAQVMLQVSTQYCVGTWSMPSQWWSHSRFSKPQHQLISAATTVC